MKDTIRILAITPYEGLAHLLKLIGSQYDMLHLDIFVGDLDQGLTIADLPDRQSKSFHLIGEKFFSIQMQKKNYKDNIFYLFFFGLSPIPKGSSKNGVRYYNHEEIKSNYFTSFFCLTAKASDLNTTLSEMLSCQPFKIVTETRLKPHRDLASAAQPCGGI